ncbi:Na(+)/citrate cotransporter-like isoform 1-T1 [Synchiropus picturatus]
MAVLPAWLRMLRRIWESRNLLIIFFTPLFLLPLVFSTPAAACAFVIILMAVYWCTEVLPLAVTALLPTILFPLLGIMESKDVCMQYLKDTNMLFVGGLMVAIAVEHWNLHKRIALRVLLLVGVRPALLMLGFMSVTAFLSMWISNTATTAMMVPIVQAVLDQLHGNVELNPRKDESHQGPVSQLQNAAKMDPVEADDKTSPEDASEDQKSVAKNLVATKPTPQDKSPTCQTEVCCPLEVEELSNNQEDEENMGKGLLLSVCYAASIGGTATLTGTGPNLILVGQMTQLFPHSNSVINFASWFAFAFPTMILMLTLTWFWLQFLFVGCNLRRAWGCGADLPQRERAAYELIKQEHGRLGRMTYAEANVLALFVLMVALWFTRDPKFMEGWATRLFNSKSEFVTDATVSLFISVLLFVLPSEPPRFLCRRSDSDSDVSPGPAPSLLTWPVTQKKLAWNIMLLLGGGFALAKGSEVSGLSRWLGAQMISLHSVPSPAIAVIICLLTATFTEFASNVATATLFLPILASLSQSIQLNPLYVMIPCTLSASFAFMLPVATPPNAMAFSYGYLKVSDMARTGVMVNIIGIGCISLAINSWGYVLFSLDTFPTWANVTTHL